MLADFAIFENFVEESGERTGAGTHGDLGEGEAASEGFVALAEGLKLVGDVESGKDGYAERIDSVAKGGDGAHFGVDDVRELLDVGGVGAAEIVDLVVNFDSDGLTLSELLWCGRGESLIHRYS